MPPQSSLLSPVVLALLEQIVAADRGPELQDNVDPLRFPDGYEGPPPGGAAERLADLVLHGAGFQPLHDDLNHADRELLVRVLAFRVLGPRKVQLPMTRARLLELAERVNRLRTATDAGPLGLGNQRADDFDLTELGFPVRIRLNAAGIVQTFVLEQYRHPGALDVGVQAGDVVIDGGAFAGDTALYFAHLAGPEGRVVSFEFDPDNLGLLRHNLSVNPKLSRRIEVAEAALWDRPGEEMAFAPAGPGTTLEQTGDAIATTDTIDALVERGTVDCVDFIKLDIEGAELNALRGAEATLRRFRPRLAVAAYHRGDDLIGLPAFLAGLGVGYRFGLGHSTMHGEETTLFADVA
jgi:FkbM family methyltransferase